MSLKPFYVRNMLLQYDRQLVTGRRLTRYRRLMGGGAEGEETIPREVKRRQLVERVAREIVENLLMSSSESEIVKAVRARLEQEMGYALLFDYPIMAQDLEIFKVTEHGPEEVTAQEKLLILNKLWKITLDKVDETML